MGGMHAEELDVENDRRALEELVGGSIEVIRSAMGLDAAFIVDPEAKQKGKPLTGLLADGTELYGDVIFVGVNADGSFCDISPIAGLVSEGVM